MADRMFTKLLHPWWRPTLIAVLLAGLAIETSSFWWHVPKWLLVVLSIVAIAVAIFNIVQLQRRSGLPGPGRGRPPRD